MDKTTSNMLLALTQMIANEEASKEHSNVCLKVTQSGRQYQPPLIPASKIPLFSNSKSNVLDLFYDFELTK